MHGDAAQQVDELPKHDLIERRAVVVLRQDAFQVGVLGLDGKHRVVDELADGGKLGVRLKVRPPRLDRHPEDILREVFVRVFGRSRIVGKQGRMLRLEGVWDVFEEYQSKNDVLILGRLQVPAQLIGGEKHFRLESEVRSIPILFSILRDIRRLGFIALWSSARHTLVFPKK